MLIDVQTIWNVFKKEKIEKQYIFTKEDNEIKAFKISMHETEQYGSLDLSTLLQLASSLYGKEIVIVHNHIKDDPKPSFQDYFQFDYLRSLFHLLHITLDDYMIVSPFGYFSFKENNLCTGTKPVHYIASPYEMLPPIDCKKIDFLQTNEEDITNYLGMYKEMIISAEDCFGSPGYFAGEDLFELALKHEKRSIFIHQYDGSAHELERLHHILEVLQPVECLIAKDGQFHPLKKIGTLSFLKQKDIA